MARCYRISFEEATNREREPGLSTIGALGRPGGGGCICWCRMISRRLTKKTRTQM